MAWAHVQDSPGSNATAHTASGTTLNTGAFGSPVTLADCVIVYAWGKCATTVTAGQITCSDNATTPNTYTQVAFTTNATDHSFVAIFVALITSNPGSGNLNPTVSVTQASSAITACAAEFSGGSTSLDGSALVNTGVSAGPASGFFSTTIASDLILYMVVVDSTSTSAITASPSSYTSVGLLSTGASSLIPGQGMYWIPGSTETTNQQWTTASANWCVAIVALKAAIPYLYPQHSQDVRPLLDYWQEWEAYSRTQPISTTFLPQPPLIGQHSQDVRPLLDFWQEWEAYRQLPYVQLFSPPPLPRQASQDVRPLLDFTSWWEQFTRLPVPLTFLVTPFPPQKSQDVRPLLDYWQEWEAYTKVSVLAWYVPPPPTHQASQDVRPLLDFWQEWEVYTQAPYAQFYPTPPLPIQGSQRIEPLPVYDFLWWEQFRLSPLPSAFFVSQEGVCGIYNLTPNVSQEGASRVANAIEGYNIYIGVNASPDLIMPPAAFSATLPITIPVAPPATGVNTLNILVVKQDTYGLQSQNQYPFVILVDSHGNQILSIIAIPQNLKLTLQIGDLLTVLASYPGVQSDAYPATQWQVWVEQTIPNVSVDTPTAIVPMNSTGVLTTTTTALTPGLWNVAVVLYRAADGATSLPITGSIIVPNPPVEVTPVPSGFQGA